LLLLKSDGAYLTLIKKQDIAEESQARLCRASRISCNEGKYLKNHKKAVDISNWPRIISPQGQQAPLWCLCWSPRNNKSWIWSGPEGSSHSDGLVCRGAAGRDAT